MSALLIFVGRQNIERFRRELTTELDPARRGVLETLLRDELARLQSLGIEAGGADVEAP